MIFKGSRDEDTPTTIRDNTQILTRRELVTDEEHYRYIVIEGDTLMTIAYKCYGDESLWWRIMESNPQYKTPLDVKPGDLLLIPLRNEV